MKEAVIVLKCADRKRLNKVADKIEGFLDSLTIDSDLEEYAFFNEWNDVNCVVGEQDG